MAPINSATSAVRGDFFTVTGTDLSPDVKLVFESATVRVEFAPDLVRPEWAWVAELPEQIPAGPNRLTLKEPGRAGRALDVNVLAGPHETVRVLCPGATKIAPATPYTVALVANPAILRRDGGIGADPAVGDRRRFHWKVRFCLRNFLELDEDLLRQFDPAIRYVAIFDDQVTPDLTSALVQEVPTYPILEPRRDAIGPFLEARNVRADVAIVLHGRDDYDRGYAWPTTDDPARGGTPFHLDGAAGTHFFYALVPGAVALPMIATSGPIALHEFCHAAASFEGGAVIDLYNDDRLKALPGAGRVNKRWRQRGGDPIPADFAVYDEHEHPSDPYRDGLGYPKTWSSYHAAPRAPGFPNLMDNYTWADQPKGCQLDGMTHAWLSDRIRAKVNR